MLFPGLNIPFTTINLYQKPIHPHWGQKKLTALCRAEFHRDPEINQLFLFYTSRKDLLKLFWRDRHGTQEISRYLPDGGFILPAPKPGEAFVQLNRQILDRLFRIPKRTPSPAPPVPADPAAELERQKRLQEAGFIEIDLGQLHILLNPVRSSPPKSSSHSKTRKTARKVVPFPTHRRGKSPRKK